MLSVFSPYFKVIQTVCFSIPFYKVNQMLCLLELIFIVKPQGLHVLLSEIWQCIYILCDSLLTNQMALSFNITTLSGYIFLQGQSKT